MFITNSPIQPKYILHLDINESSQILPTDFAPLTLPACPKIISFYPENTAIQFEILPTSLL